MKIPNSQTITIDENEVMNMLMEEEHQNDPDYQESGRNSQSEQPKKKRITRKSIQFLDSPISQTT